MFNSKNRNRTTKVLAIACVGAMLVGSFAYFTDRIEYRASVNSGNVQIESTAFAGADQNDILVDRDGKDNFNPGDVRDLSFTVTNTGTKAIDLRHTMKLTVLDGAGAALPLNEVDGQAEFEIYKKGDVQYTPKAGYVILNNAKPVFTGGTLDATLKGATRTLDGNSITYHFADTTLLGNNTIANAERTATPDTDVAGHIDIGDKHDSVEYEYVLVYRDSSLNKFMNSQVQIDMVVEAKQHYNTNDDWTEVARQIFTTGNLTIDQAVANRSEDTVGGTAVNTQNNIATHNTIVGTVGVTNSTLETELKP